MNNREAIKSTKLNDGTNSEPTETSSFKSISNVNVTRE
jgi:hypothetical protein